MFRWCYFALLRLHPAPFRVRFGEEMLGIFDDAWRSGRRSSLFLDVLISLFRQWVLRPRKLAPAPSLAAPTSGSEVPVFHTFDTVLPGRGALINGVLMAVLCFGAVSFAIGRGGGQFPRLMIGAFYPRPHVLPVERASVMESEPTTRVKVEPPAIDPLYELADIYFKIIPVLRVLDGDGDRILSAREIAGSRLPLTKLDMDRNGHLSPEECGFYLGERFDERFQARARAAFMRLNPVLAALDSDRNGEISGVEIELSSAALRSLDKNGDGSLAPAEVLPDAGDNQTALILSRLDQDGDRQISREESQSERAQPMRELLDRADRNGDGIISAVELRNEVRRRGR